MKRRGYLKVMRSVVHICRLTSTLDFASSSRYAYASESSQYPSISISIGCESTIEYQYNDDHVRMCKLIKCEYQTVA